MTDPFENIKKQLFRIEKKIENAEEAYAVLPTRKAPKPSNQDIFHVLTRAHNLRNIPLSKAETTEVMNYLLKDSTIKNVAKQLLVDPSTVKSWVAGDNTPSGAGRLKLNYIRLVEGML